MRNVSKKKSLLKPKRSPTQPQEIYLLSSTIEYIKRNVWEVVDLAALRRSYWCLILKLMKSSDANVAELEYASNISNDVMTHEWQQQRFPISTEEANWRTGYDWSSIIMLSSKKKFVVSCGILIDAYVWGCEVTDSFLVSISLFYHTPHGEISLREKPKS